MLWYSIPKIARVSFNSEAYIYYELNETERKVELKGLNLGMTDTLFASPILDPIYPFVIVHSAFIRSHAFVHTVRIHSSFTLDPNPTSTRAAYSSCRQLFNLADTFSSIPASTCIIDYLFSSKRVAICLLKS